jgi:hypothetical protein
VLGTRPILSYSDKIPKVEPYDVGRCHNLGLHIADVFLGSMKSQLPHLKGLSRLGKHHLGLIAIAARSYQMLCTGVRLAYIGGAARAFLNLTPTCGVQYYVPLFLVHRMACRHHILRLPDIRNREVPACTCQGGVCCFQGFRLRSNRLSISPENS